MPDDFVDKVKSGVRDMMNASPFFGVGQKMSEAGDAVMREYQHYKRKLTGEKPSSKPPTKRSMATPRRR